MNIKKRLLISLLLLGLVFTFTGALFASSQVVLDPDRHILYQNFTADEVLKAFNADRTRDENKFEDVKVAVLGRVSSLSAGNVGLKLGSIDSKYQSVIECTSLDLDVVNDFKALKPGDRVILYGEVSAGLFGASPTMRVEDLKITDEEPKNDKIYSTVNGSDIDTSNMVSYNIGDRVEFTVPAEWKTVAHDLTKEDLGSIPGYQFRLNEIRGKQTASPESFFVCYFDNDLLQNASDKAKTDQIEEAIIRNILKKDSITGFPLKKETTYYGTKYQYYQDAYQDKMGNGYHMEFVFEADGTDGVVVYLYVYKDQTHLDEIIAVMRFLK